jgi:hypothetical protein
MFARIGASRAPSAARPRLPVAVLGAVAAAICAAAPALGQDSGARRGASENSLALKVGALGLGVEYSRSFGDRLAVRGAVYGAQIGFDGDEGGIEYDSELIWDSLSIGVDFHPGKGPFRLSGGYLNNDNRIEASSAPVSSEEIGDSSYTAAQIGTLNGLITFDDSATFGGVGWDWSRDGGFGMSLDVGLVSQGSPVAELSATGLAASNAAFQQDLENEELQIEEDLEDIDLVPYLTLGFVFRF